MQTQLHDFVEYLSHWPIYVVLSALSSAIFYETTPSSVHPLFSPIRAVTTPFWASCGYRYPAESRYMQPPINFNLDTGDPESPEVAELLMVKNVSDQTASMIEKQLLIDGVSMLYRHWYSATGNTPEATQKIRDLVFSKMLTDYTASLAKFDKEVSLIMPPLV
jgi:hypothetical protein